MNTLGFLVNEVIGGGWFFRNRVSITEYENLFVSRTTSIIFSKLLSRISYL